LCKGFMVFEMPKAKGQDVGFTKWAKVKA